MTETTDALVLDLVRDGLRANRGLIPTCSRSGAPHARALTIWEDAVDRGYVARRRLGRGGMRVTVTATGETFLRAHGRMHSRAPAFLTSSTRERWTSDAAIVEILVSAWLGEPRPDDLDHRAARPEGARREEAEIIAVAVHQIDVGGVIDGVVAGVLRHLGVIDLVGVGDLADRVGAAGQPDQPRMEQRHVVGEMLGGVALGIDRDEDRLHLIAVARRACRAPARSPANRSGRRRSKR